MCGTRFVWKHSPRSLVAVTQPAAPVANRPGLPCRLNTVHVARQGSLESPHLPIPAAIPISAYRPFAVRGLAVCALAVCSLVAAALFAGCQAAPVPAHRQSAAATTADPRLDIYLHQVQPILQNNCFRCHTGMNRRGGLSMGTRALLLQGGKDGPAVLPGRPEDSLLIKLISPGLADGDPMRMPQKGTLTPREVSTLRKWVADGAVMDR